MKYRCLYALILTLIATTLSFSCGSSERRGTPTGNDDTTNTSTDELFAEFFARVQFEESGERDYTCRCYPEDLGYASTDECLNEHDPLPDDFVETMETCFNEELQTYADPEDDLVAPLRSLLLIGLDALDEQATCLESARQATECTAANDEAFTTCEDERAATIDAADDEVPDAAIEWLDGAAEMLFGSSCRDLIP